MFAQSRFLLSWATTKIIPTCPNSRSVRSAAYIMHYSPSMDRSGLTNTARPESSLISQGTAVKASVLLAYPAPQIYVRRWRTEQSNSRCESAGVCWNTAGSLRFDTSRCTTGFSECLQIAPTNHIEKQNNSVFNIDGMCCSVEKSDNDSAG